MKKDTLFDDISGFKANYSVIGQGVLYNKPMEEELKLKRMVVYDKKLDQYCVDGQWILPFHRESKIKNYENIMLNILSDIKQLKNNLVLNQKFEAGAIMRDLERDFEKHIELVLKFIKEE
jgi:hypothetical protein